MHKTAALRLAGLLVGTLLTRDASAADDIKVDVVVESCASGTATIIQGELCFVQDIVVKETFWEFTMRFGGIAGASVPGLGAEVKATLTIKLTFPRSKYPNRSDVVKYVASNKAALIARATEEAQKKDVRVDVDLARYLAAPDQNACHIDDPLGRYLKSENACHLKPKAR